MLQIKLNGLDLRADLVFLQVVSAETIPFWKLEWGNHSKDETIVFLFFGNGYSDLTLLIFN